MIRYFIYFFIQMLWGIRSIFLEWVIRHESMIDECLLCVSGSESAGIPLGRHQESSRTQEAAHVSEPAEHTSHDKDDITDNVCVCVCVVRLQRSADRKKFSPSEEEKWKLVPKMCRVSKRITARWRTLLYSCFILVCSNICQLFSVLLFMFPLRCWRSEAHLLLVFCLSTL